MSKPPEFAPFPKMARLSRDIIVTEKLDGTNAQITITEDGGFFTGSRKRWIIPGDDNFGFAAWAHANRDELMQLGPGTHFGEWWGRGIQRGYDLEKRRFSLFNTTRWGNGAAPRCCHVVPVLYEGPYDNFDAAYTVELLRREGSVAAPGFMDPEGFVLYHVAGNVGFKKTVKNDGVPKGTLT